MPDIASPVGVQTELLRTLFSIAFVCLFIAVPVAGCTSSSELTRPYVAELLKRSKSLQPVFITLDPPPEWATKATSSDEPENEAQARAIDEYANYFAHIYVFRHFGLIEVKATTLERPTLSYLFWKFKLAPVLTEKGKGQAMKDSEVPSRQRIVIANREIIEVTGITKPRGDVAQVDFTWKLVPTEVGEAFDTNSITYKNLPEALRQIIIRPTSATFKTAARNYGGTNKSTAILRRYDDGWRVQSLQE